MKTRIFILLFCLCYRPCAAQDFEGEAFNITDSLCQYADLCDHDSIVSYIVSRRVGEAKTRGSYSWPFWYLQNDWKLNPPHDTDIRYPSPTQQLLMESKYAVSMDYPSNGCLWQRAFVIHDSLMMVAIRERYGSDFFQRVSAEADLLDSIGKGLQFPYIGSSQRTDSMLRAAFRHLVATTDTLSDEGKQRYLEIYFQKGQAVHAIVMNDSGLGFSFDHAGNDEKPYVNEIVQTLSWTPPTFLGQPVDRTVLWNVATGELRWR